MALLRKKTDSHLFLTGKSGCQLFLMLCLAGCAGIAKPLLYSPSSMLPHTVPEMMSAGFWISRHPTPDKVILTPDEILQLNRHIQDELKLTKDLGAWSEAFPGSGLRQSLTLLLKDLEERNLVHADGRQISPSYWENQEEAFYLEAIPENIPRQYGIVVHYADQRLLPVETGLYAKAYDLDFDELQNSALDLGTPVVILHMSRDDKWAYVESSLSAGWVKAENVVRVTEEQVTRFLGGPFAVAIVPKADIYLDEAMTRYYGTIRMGNRLPWVQARERSVEVLLIDKSTQIVSGFMAAEQIHEGYLSYTPRQVIQQAFKMLHQPYGWGDVRGGQDCSRFLQEVFATVGIELPRDSKNQIQAGELLARWEPDVSSDEKTRLLKEKGLSGITVLGMKGHILLYLGNKDERSYAIHSVWAYRLASQSKEDEVYVLNRVTLSDLSLGEGSRRGSLLERLNAVRLIK